MIYFPDDWVIKCPVKAFGIFQLLDHSLDIREQHLYNF